MNNQRMWSDRDPGVAAVTETPTRIDANRCRHRDQTAMNHLKGCLISVLEVLSEDIGCHCTFRHLLTFRSDNRERFIVILRV